jgi:fructuronate reductase
MLNPILSNKKIFGVDLIDIGLGKAILNDFTEMMAGPGAVRAALQKNLSM